MGDSAVVDAPARRPERDDVAELEYRRVGRRFLSGGSPFTAVQDVDLTVRSGEFVCLIGPSGCGKTTVLNMASGLLPYTSGELRYRGTPVKGINTHVGYVSQKDTLLPWRTVAGNVALPLEVQGVGRRERRARVDRMLEQVGLSGFRNRYPSQISGGMLKRTALAQTLVYEPTTILMDEPFGALDAQLRLSLQRELLQLWERQRKTVMFVTHDLEEAMALADRVVVFGTNPGRIIHIEQIDLPRPRFDVPRSDPRYVELWERLWSLLRPGLEESHGRADHA